MRWLISCLAVGASGVMPLIAAPPEMLGFRQAGDTIDGIFLMREAPLTKESAISYARRVAGLNFSSYRTLKVAIFAEQRDADEFHGSARNCLSYAECSQLAAKARIPSGIIAEVLETKLGSALRYRTAGGEISRQVLSGEDPYVIRAGDSIFEIVHLMVSASAPLLRHRPGGDRRVEVFLRSLSAFSKDDCGKATAKIADLLGHNWVWVNCRADATFWYSTIFPIYHPFVEEHRIPTVGEFQRTKRIGCMVDQSRLHCADAP